MRKQCCESEMLAAVECDETLSLTPVRPQVRIFVLSLQRRQDRRRHMQNLLASLGLEAEFIDAVDGNALTPAQASLYDRDRALAVYGTDMNPAEIGCHLSHLAAYRRIIAENLDAALVLEDDIECDADLPRLLRAALADRRSPWQILRLQSTKRSVIEADRPNTRGLAVSHCEGRSVARLRCGVLGGCGYLVKREGAIRMLAYASRPFMPIDQAIDRYWENGITPFVMRPFPVRQCESIRSEIGERILKADLGPAVRRARRRQRLKDAVYKRAYQFTHLGGWPVNFGDLAIDLRGKLAAALARPQANDPWTHGDIVPDLAD